MVRKKTADQGCSRRGGDAPFVVIHQPGVAKSAIGGNQFEQRPSDGQFKAMWLCYDVTSLLVICSAWLIDIK
jgi:hypothetical protein